MDGGIFILGRVSFTTKGTKVFLHFSYFKLKALKKEEHLSFLEILDFHGD